MLGEDIIISLYVLGWLSSISEFYRLLILCGIFGLFIIEDVEVLLCPLFNWPSYPAVIGLLFAIETFYHCLLLGIVDVAVLPNICVWIFPVDESCSRLESIVIPWPLLSFICVVSAFGSLLAIIECIASVGTGGFIIYVPIIFALISGYLIDRREFEGFAAVLPIGIVFLISSYFC